MNEGTNRRSLWRFLTILTAIIVLIASLLYPRIQNYVEYRRAKIEHTIQHNNMMLSSAVEMINTFRATQNRAPKDKEELEQHFLKRLPTLEFGSDGVSDSKIYYKQIDSESFFLHSTLCTGPVRYDSDQKNVAWRKWDGGVTYD